MLTRAGRRPSNSTRATGRDEAGRDWHLVVKTSDCRRHADVSSKCNLCWFCSSGSLVQPVHGLGRWKTAREGKTRITSTVTWCVGGTWRSAGLESVSWHEKRFSYTYEDHSWRLSGVRCVHDNRKMSGTFRRALAPGESSRRTAHKLCCGDHMFLFAAQRLRPLSPKTLEFRCLSKLTSLSSSRTASLFILCYLYAIKTRWNIMIDRWDWPPIGRACESPGSFSSDSIPWLPLALNGQDGGLRDIPA